MRTKRSLISKLRVLGLLFVLSVTGCSTSPVNQTAQMSFCPAPSFQTLGYINIDNSFNGCSNNGEIYFSDNQRATCEETIPRSIDKQVVLLEKTTRFDQSYFQEERQHFTGQRRVIQDSYCFEPDHSWICQLYLYTAQSGDTRYSSQAKNFQEPIRLKRSFYTYQDHIIVESGGQTTYNIFFDGTHDIGQCIWEDANGNEFGTALPWYSTPQGLEAGDSRAAVVERVNPAAMAIEKQQTGEWIPCLSVLGFLQVFDTSGPRRSGLEEMMAALTNDLADSISIPKLNGPFGFALLTGLPRSEVAKYQRDIESLISFGILAAELDQIPTPLQAAQQVNQIREIELQAKSIFLSSIPNNQLPRFSECSELEANRP